MENDVKEDLEQARPKLELEKQKQELEKLTQEKEQEIKKRKKESILTFFQKLLRKKESIFALLFFYSCFILF
ncbi:hypothetical protein HpBT039_02460 [Helicobacter pylori]